LEESPIPTSAEAQGTARPPLEIEHLREELHAAIERSRGELERMETLLLALKLHERGNTLA